MVFDSSSITAFATVVYGGATLALVFQLWRDRVQREEHFSVEKEARKQDELRSAFYEAWGYWEGHWRTAGSVAPDASQVGKQFEALARLECQLRLNGFTSEANDLGFATRAEWNDIHAEISKAGVAIGLLSAEYRRSTAMGFSNPS